MSEEGLESARGASVGDRVVYAAAGRAAIWTVTSAGFEEWLHFEADDTRTASSALATWNISGGTVRSSDAGVEVVDGDGRVAWSVTAPAGFTPSGRELRLRLEGAGSTLRLFLAAEDADAVTGEMLLDPYWHSGVATSLPRVLHSAAVMNDGRVIAMGGCATTGFSGCMANWASDLYSPWTHSMTTGGSALTGHSQFAMQLLPNGLVFAQDEGSAPLAESYSIASDSWTALPAPSAGVASNPTIRTASGDVVALGGYTGSGYSNAIQRYNVAGNNWSTGTLSQARFESAATLLSDGRILHIGGHNGAVSNVVEVIDPSTLAATTRAVLPTAARRINAVRLANDTIYVFGGSLGTTTYIYTVGSNSWAAGPSLVSAADQSSVVTLPNGDLLLTGPGTTVQRYNGSWATTLSMSAARERHSAMMLPNGRLFILGGADGSGNGQTSTEYFDYFNPTMTATTALTGARQDATATALFSGEVLVVGGSSGGTAVSTTQLYSTSGTWSAGGAMSAIRTRHSASLLRSGKVLVAGGLSTGGTAVATAQIYDRTANAFSNAASMAAPRSGHTATVLPNGKVLVVGGAATSTACELYDPGSNSWAAAASLTTGRTGHAATLLSNDKVLVCGGGTANCELYTISTNAWASAGALPSSATRVTQTELPNDKVLVTIGGTTTARLYDIAGNSWSASLTMPNTHANHTATLLPNHKVAIFGNAAHGSRIVTVYDYLDTATPWRTVTGTTTGRESHAAELLRNGTVLFVGGVAGGSAVATADIFDEGRASAAASTPTLTAISNPSGSTVTMTGTLFQGRYIGGGGNARSVQTNSPFLLLRNRESDEIINVPTTGWTSATSATATLPSGLKFGAYRANVVVNGIASNDYTFTYAGGATQLDWTTASRTFTANTCMGAAQAITVRLEDGAGAAVVAPTGGVGFRASSTSTGTVSWFTDATCATAATGGNFTIPAGSSSVNLYYRDTKAGTPSISLTNSLDLDNPAAQSQTVNPGAATALSITTEPTDAVAGATLSPAVVVTVVDGSGNTVTSSSANITLAIGTNPGGSTLGGTVTVAASSGVATFSTLSLNKTGTNYTLTAASSGITGATSTNFNVTPGAANKVAFTTQPSTVVAGATMSAVQVTVQDANNNTVTSSSANITLAIGTNPGGSTLGGTLTVAASSGVATFSTLSLNKTGTNYTLTAASSGITGATSTNFNVTPGAATKLAYTVQPTDASAGASLSPAVQVTVQDANDNTVTSSSASITVAIGTNPGSSTLSGTTTVAASGGVATFSNLSLNKTGAGYTLTAASSGITGATSSNFSITPGAANRLAFSVQPTSAASGASLTPAVQVTVQDANSNTVTSSTANITLAIGANPGSSTLGGTATVAASSGVATFSNLSLNKVGTNYTLTAASSGLTGATSANFNITPGAAAKLAFTVQPSNVVAGATVTPSVQVTVQDSNDNTVTASTASIALSLGSNPGSSTLGGTTTVAATSGVATFSTLSLNKTGTGYTLTAAASGLTGATSSTFNVTPGVATKLAFAVQPSNAAAGASLTPSVQVTVQDANNNTVTSSTATIAVAIGTNPGNSTLGGTASVAAVSGVATFSNLSLNKTGAGYTLAASSSGLTGSTSASFDITPGAATKLAFTVQPSNTVAGATLAPAVQVVVQDTNNNTVTSSTANITLAIGANPGSSTLSGTTTVAATAGVASFSTLSLNRTGTGYTLAASSGGLTGSTSNTFTITPGTAVKLAFTVQPTSTTAGTPIAPAIQVTVQDTNNNTVTSSTASITLAIGTNPGGSSLSGPVTVAASGGVATFSNVSLNRTGTGYTLGASSGGLTGASSNTFNIGANSASQLAFLVQPSNTAAGATITPAVQVEVQDASGNRVTSSTSSVTLALGTNPGGSALGGTLTVAAVSGVATFSDLSLDKTGAFYSLTASAGGLSNGTSASFNVTPGAATKLAFSVQPTSTTAGTALSPSVQVTVQDANNNTVTSSTASITLAIGTNPGASTLGGTVTVSASSGVATFPGVSLNKVGTGYTLSSASSGLTGATSSTFNITPGAATQLAFTVEPTSTTAAALLSPAVQVRVQDANGNTVTSSTASITLAIGTNPGSSTLSGTTTVAASSGVATFSNLSLNRVGTGYTLTAAASGLTGDTSAAFNITPGAATQLAFTVQPTSTTAGATLSPAVQVTVRDGSGNTVTSSTASITLAIGTNPGSSTLSGTTTVAASAGVATFSNLSLNRTGTGYTLAATSSGLSGATSGTFNISPGAATQLAFTVQPSVVAAGAAVTPAVQVTVRDASGNTVTSSSASITVAIGTNAGGSTLAGTTTVAASSGVATFSNLSLNKTGVGYTFTAAASGLSAATSSAFDVDPGAATKLAFTVQPTNVAAGGTLSTVQVTVQDANDNTVTSSAASIALSLATNPGGSTLSGTTTVVASGGVANFSTLSLDKAGTGYSLRVVASGLANDTSSTFNVTPGAATKLVFTTQPTSTTAGASLSPAVQVTVQDANNNTVTSSTASITLAIGTNPGSSTLSGTKTVSATAGVASFPGLSLNRVGTGYTLTAAASGLSGATSSTFSITPGAATKLAFTVQPSTTVAGATVSPAVQVTVQDANNNTVTASTASITLSIGTNPGASTLSGTVIVAASSGVASFSTLSLNRTGTGYTLAAAASGLTGDTSASFNITPGTATKLAFTVQPSNAASGAALTPAVQVTVQDANNNTVTSSTANISLAVGTNPGSSTLGGTTTAAASSGVATFSTLTLDKVGTGYTLAASSSGLTSATSSTFNITAGAATKLAFTVQPSNAAAGATVSPAVQVTVRDANDNPVTSSTASITLALGSNSGSSTLGGTTTVTATAGVASFSTLSLNKSGVGYTLSATASGLSPATSSTFDITAGTATRIAFTVQPTSTTAGATLSPAVQVSVQDANGNTVTGSSASITLAIGTNPGSSTLSGSTTSSAASGVATFSALSLDKVGTGYRLSATASGLTGDTSATFNITPGAATRLDFTAQPLSTTAGATLSNVEVTVRDANDNTVTSSTASITVALSANPGGSTLSGTTTVSAVAGVATFSTLSLNRVGTGYALSATSAGLTNGGSASFNITPGTATKLAFTVQPSNAASGVSLSPSVQVTVQDANNNTVSSSTASITLAIGTNPGASTLSGTTTVSAASGVATFSNLSLNRVGTGYTLTAAASGLTGATSSTFNITPGAATKLAFTVQPSNTVAGATVSPSVQVTVQDANNNTVTSASTSITLAIGTNPGSSTLGGTTTVVASSGVATFSTLSLNKVGTGYTLAATGSGLTAATSSTFNITVGAAARLAFTSQPTSNAASTALSPAVEVTVQDANGNTVTASSASITVALGSNPGGSVLSGTTTVSATAGVASFSNLALDKVGSGYTLTAASGGLTGDTSDTFDISASGATRLAFIVQPSTTVAGVTMTPSVQVAVQDGSGNTVTAANNSITLTIGTNPGGSTLSGTVTAVANSGVATFSNLSLNKSGTGYRLTATASGLSSANSTTFNITAGTANRLAFTVQPSNTVAGAVVSPAVQVSVQDSNGNTVPSANNSITLAIGTNPGSSTLGGTVTVAASSGVATFSTLTLNRTGAAYTLTAAASGLSGATSSTFDITPGAATQLAFAIQPSNVTAGGVISPSVQVTVRDANNNTVTTATTAITMALSNNPGASTLSGTTTVSATGGTAVFSTLSLDRAGTGYTLSASASGLGSVTSAAFDVTAGGATRLAFTVQPSNAVAGVALSPAVQVQIQDGNGNVITSATNAVTLAIGTNPGSSTLGGTVTVSAVSGVATFSNVSLDKSGVGYTLSAAAGGLTSATSSSFNITPGVANRLAFTVQPASTTAASTLTPAVRVTVQDANGNTVTSSTASITVAIGTNPGGSTLSGSTTLSAASGVANFSSLSLDKVGTGYTLTASASGLTGATSSTFNITPAAATRLAFTVQPSNVIAGAGISPAVQVTVQDTSGNTVTSSTASITVAIGTNVGGSTLGGMATVAATGGVATFPGLSLNRAGTGYTLTGAASGLTGATSSTFNVTAGAATKLAFTVQPSSTSAGTSLSPSVQVTVQDANNNTVTSSSASITVAIGTNPGGSTLSGTTTVAASSGVATFSNLALNRVGTGYTLGAAASGLTSPSSSSFDITPGAANRLVFSVPPSDSVAGATMSPAVVVTVQDASGNAVPSATPSITLALVANPGGSTLSGATTVTATSGAASFSNLSLDKVGTAYTLSATASGLTSATSATFNVTPAGATRLAFLVQPSNATAGASIAPTVQVAVQDTNGNTVTSANNAITIALGANPGSSTLSGTVTVNASGGIASFSSLSLNRVGTGYTLTAAASGLTGATSATFNVSAGAANRLVYTTPSRTFTAATCGGAGNAITVQLQDAFGNAVNAGSGGVSVTAASTSTGTVTWFTSGTCGTVATGGLYAIPNGSNSVSLFYRDTLAGTPSISLTNGSSLANPTAQSQTVVAGSGGRLAFLTPPRTFTANACGGSANVITVQLQDLSGNPTAAGAGGQAFTVSSSSTGTVGYFTNNTCGTAAAGGTFTIPSGSNQVGVFYVDSLAGTPTVSLANASGLVNPTGQVHTVGAAGPSRLVFSTPARSLVAGTCTSVLTVSLQDASGNAAVAGAAGTVLLASNAGTTTFHADAACATAGVSSRPMAAGAGSVSFYVRDTRAGAATLTASQSPLTSATQGLTTSAGSVQALAFRSAAQTVVAGDCSGAVELQSRDMYGNPSNVASATDLTVTSTSTANAFFSDALCNTALGTPRLQAGENLATVYFRDTRAARPTLSVEADGLAEVTQQQTVNAGPGANVAIVNSTTTVGSGGTFTATVNVTDAFGNPSTNYTGTVSLTSSDGAATLPAPYTFTGTESSHTFNVTLTSSGIQTVTVTDNGAPPLTSTSAPITVTSGAVSTIWVTGLPSPLSVGTAATFTVELRDNLGNRANGYVGTLRFSSSDATATLPAPYTFTPADAGIHTFTGQARFNRAGTVTLVATDTASPTLQGQQSGVVITQVSGGACSTASECGTGFCEGGVCCNTTCSGTCSTCAAPGSEGVCSPKSDGATCNDSLFCNGAESCQSGVCQSGTPVVCESESEVLACSEASRACAPQSSPPIITEDAVLVAGVGNAYVYNALQAIRVKGTRPMTFSACGGPVGFHVEARSGSVTWTPRVEGVVTLCVAASNALGRDEYTFDVTVSAVTGAPAPSARFSATPARGQAPLAVTVNANDTTVDPASLPASYFWDFGGGALPVAGPSTATVYLMPGSYPVKLTVVDAKGRRSVAASDVSVETSSGVVPPRARITATSLQGSGSLTSTFSCDCAEGDAPIRTLRWDFGNATPVLESSPTRTFAPGRYHVRLTVLDEAGLTAEDTVEVMVTSETGREPPSCRAFATPVQGSVPTPVHLRALFAQPLGSVTESRWSLWTGESVTDPELDRTIPTAGVYRASLHVVDDEGLTCDDSVTLHLVNAPGDTPPGFLDTPSVEALCGEPIPSLGNLPRVVSGAGPFEYSLEAVEGSSLPEGLSIDPQTGVLAWTASSEQTGDYQLRIKVRGSSGEGQQVVDLAVACEAPGRLRVGCGCNSSGEFAGLAGVVLVLAAMGRRRRERGSAKRS